MPEEEHDSADGTRKALFRFGSGRLVETAALPDRDRVTLCLSTQAGCARGCRFCRTGLQGLQGSLSSGEILSQYAACPQRDRVTNIVYMGMGEPFDNTDAVLRSLRVMTDPLGYAMSPRRITVSTVGVRPGLDRFLSECKCHLAISLHTPFSDQRRELLPVEEHFPLREVLDLLRRHDFTGQRRLTFEMILFDGINDSEAHARETIRLLGQLPCRINLIPYNEADMDGLKPAGREATEAFQHRLEQGGLRTTIRRSRGEDIGAACGLLSTQAHLRKTT